MKKQKQVAPQIVLPGHINQLIDQIQRRGVEDGGVLIGGEQTGFESVRLRALQGGGHNPNLSVVISFLIGPEETTTVVFEDASKPVGQNSVTRHYQPHKYLGVTKSNDPEKPIPANNSQHYTTNITRQDIGGLVLDVVYYLMRATLPNAWHRDQFALS